MTMTPEDVDSVVGAAWDKDNHKFYDDDTGWAERGYAHGFAAGATWGAEWALAGMAVCEFLSALAAHVNACPVCERGCYACNGTGKRVTP